MASDVSGTSTIALGTLSGSGTLNNALTGSRVTYQIGGNNQSSEFDGVVEDGAGVVALQKIGTATLTLGGENTYTGGTTITQGTLKGAASCFGTGSITLADGTLSSNGTLRNAIVVTPDSTCWINADLLPLTLTGSLSATGWPLVYHTGAQLNLAGDDSRFGGNFVQQDDNSLVTCFTSASAGSAAGIWHITSGVLESDIAGTATIQLALLFARVPWKMP